MAYFSFLLSLAVGVVICVVVAGVYLIDAFSPYTWYNGSTPQIDVLKQLLGGILVSVYTPFGVGVLLVVTDQLFPWAMQSNTAATFSGAELQPKIFVSANLKSIAFICVAIIFVFILTLFLPHMWTCSNPIAKVLGPFVYFTLDSPYSLVHNVLWYKGDITHYSYQNVTIEIDDFLIVNETVVEYLPDPDYVQPMIYLKLFPDVLVYYCFISAIIAVGCLATYHTPTRRFLHRRIDVSFIPKVLNLWPVGASLGELLLTTTVTALHCYWFWYWSTGWLYRPDSVAGSYSSLQVYARVMGEMSILTMSFLTFPVTHNSVWESVFGVPVDR